MTLGALAFLALAATVNELKANAPPVSLEIKAPSVDAIQVPEYYAFYLETPAPYRRLAFRVPEMTLRAAAILDARPKLQPTTYRLKSGYKLVNDAEGFYFRRARDAL